MLSMIHIHMPSDTSVTQWLVCYDTFVRHLFIFCLKDYHQGSDAEIRECLDSISVHCKGAPTAIFLFLYVMLPIKAKPPPIGLKLFHTHVHLLFIHLMTSGTQRGLLPVSGQ